MALKDELGSFCWFSLMTKDTATATKFYKGLFDWTTMDLEFPDGQKVPMYALEDCSFANPVPLDQEGIPSHWISYIAVEDVDETCSKAVELGGKILVPKFQLPTVGWTSVVADPSGAPFHVFTPDNKDQPVNVLSDDAGRVCWMELMVDDPAPLVPFYKAIANWEFSDPMPMNGGEYISFKINGKGQGGLMKRPPNVPKMPAAWVPYFATPDLKSSNKKAASLGAKIHMEEIEIPDTGVFSVVEDPSGATFYLFEWRG